MNSLKMKIAEEKILSELPIGVLFFNSEFEISFVNKSFLEFNIIDEDDNKILGLDFRKISFVDEELKREIEKISNGNVIEKQIDFTRKLSGKLLSIVLKASPIYDGEIFVGGIVIVEDLIITDNNDRENIIRTRFFNTLMKSISVHYLLFDSNWNVLFEPKLDIEISIKYDFTEAKNYAVKHISKTLDGEGKVLFHDKVNNKFLEIGFVTFKLDGMQTSFNFLIFRDVTEEKQKLLSDEKRLKSIESNIVGGNLFLVVNEKGIVLEFNSGNEELRKFLQIEDGTILFDVFGEELSEKIKELEQSEFVAYNLNLKRKNVKKYLQLIFVNEGEEHKKNILILIKDNTEELEKENKIQELKSDYQKITNNISEIFWQAEKVKGKIQIVSITENAKRIFGTSNLKKFNNVFFWLKLVHPNDRKLFFQSFKKTYANKISKNINFDFKIIGKGNQIFNLRLNVDILRNNQNEIIGLEGKISDITDLVFEKEKITKDVTKLTELNQAKDRFISIISHDLRTPFSSILGFTDLLLGDSQVSKDEQRQYIQYIQNSSQSMMNLLNSLLDWTRLQTGRIQFQPIKLNLKNIVKQAIETVRGTAIQKEIDLQYYVDENIFIHADESLISQVFGNLLGNALKFTKKGDSIVVSASEMKERNSIEISVKDTGVGIKTEDIPKLFKVDSKFTNLGTSGEKGTGLGLSLVYEIIKKHEGDIRVESEFGKGTNFIFSIPISSSNILLIDGNKTEALLYSKLIRSFFPEFKIFIANNNEEVLNNLETYSPIIIFSELEMKNYSIYELLEKVEILKKRFKTKVIVLTREKSQKALNDINSTEVFATFSKPVDLVQFKKVVTDAIRS